MEDFNLVLRDLVEKDIPRLKQNLPESLKLNFEVTANNYLAKDQVLEAIKAFAITDNKEKLNEIGFNCIKKGQRELAFKAFCYSENKEGLSAVGIEFMKQGEVTKATEAFKLAENKEMVSFFTENF